MSLKKLLGIISVVIVVMFTLMLTTSYAWYSFEKASTTFDVVTNNDDIIISYQKGEYISTNIAVPIKRVDVEKYSEKNNFSIVVKDNEKDNEMLVTISLVDISIDKELQNEDFKIELYHQDNFVIEMNGIELAANEDATKELGTVTLEDYIDNNFELRVYILDDETDQSIMMNKTFQAKIKIDAVSRLKSSINNYDNPDIYVNSITIDGEISDSLPADGYYTMSAICSKGSKLSWDSLAKTITYESGSKVNDSCDLTFISSTDYPLLSEMQAGSYVKYVATNGCNGKSCQGQNANYVSDKDMGYCNTKDAQFMANGWRIGYVEDGSAYLISAGATDCMCTNSDGTSSNGICNSYLSSDNLDEHFNNMNDIALKYCNKNYASDGVCDNTTAWAMNVDDFKKMVGNNLNFTTCYNSINNKSCGYFNDLIDNGGKYWFADTYLDKDIYSWLNKGYVSSMNSANSNGIRPVLWIDSGVVVVGGAGTYADPYLIGMAD